MERRLEGLADFVHFLSLSLFLLSCSLEHWLANHQDRDPWAAVLFSLLRTSSGTKPKSSQVGRLLLIASSPSVYRRSFRG